MFQEFVKHLLIADENIFKQRFEEYLGEALKLPEDFKGIHTFIELLAKKAKGSLDKNEEKIYKEEMGESEEDIDERIKKIDYFCSNIPKLVTRVNNYQVSGLFDDDDDIAEQAQAKDTKRKNLALQLLVMNSQLTGMILRAEKEKRESVKKILQPTINTVGQGSENEKTSNNSTNAPQQISGKSEISDNRILQEFVDYLMDEDEDVFKERFAGYLANNSKFSKIAAVDKVFKIVENKSSGYKVEEREEEIYKREIEGSEKKIAARIENIDNFQSEISKLINRVNDYQVPGRFDDNTFEQAHIKNQKRQQLLMQLMSVKMQLILVLGKAREEQRKIGKLLQKGISALTVQSTVKNETNPSNSDNTTLQFSN